MKTFAVGFRKRFDPDWIDFIVSCLKVGLFFQLYIHKGGKVQNLLK